jgi:hypothetical protein
LGCPPLLGADQSNNNNNIHEENEELIFKNVKIYADQGNGCFTNKEILSIHLLGIMKDIGAHLKARAKLLRYLKMKLLNEKPSPPPSIINTLQSNIFLNHFA